ncbi:hypothetical protein CKW48_21695, partial [Bordetella pertussis]
MCLTPVLEGKPGPPRPLPDALLQAGVEPLYDCRRGECGMCLTPVLEGKPGP